MFVRIAKDLFCLELPVSFWLVKIPLFAEKGVRLATDMSLKQK